MEPLIHYNITVKGRVQNVSYRAYTKTAAQNLKLTGFVKNTTNGNVYIEVEGPRTNIEKLVDWCHQGSPRSKVDSVETEPANMKYFDNFQIKQ